MSKINPEASKLIDEYIIKSSDSYKPLLKKLRKIIIKADDRLVEDWKWSVPIFGYKGIICWLAHFKSHIGINFFKGALINDSYGIFDQTDSGSKGNRIVKIRNSEEINEEALSDYIKQGILLNENDLKPNIPKKHVDTPEDFMCALQTNPAASKIYYDFSYAKRKDYIEWITSAKREGTRKKRIDQSIEWISQGKDRNWKYH